jgi:glycosyltransferase involved in cell wall biosynthesis
MRILVISNLYPPVVRGGYEVECSGVVAHLRERGDDVLVLTSALERELAPAAEARVSRELAFLSPDRRGAVRAPLASVRAARVARELARDLCPDLVYVWNGSQIPQAAIAALAQEGLPLAYRVCEHWFGRLWSDDQFMRHLQSGDRGLRWAWGAGLRVLNRHPALRLTASPGTDGSGEAAAAGSGEAAAAGVPAAAIAPHRAAISWNSETIRRLAGTPPPVAGVLERVIHSTSIRAPQLEALERRPAPRPTIAFLGRISSEKGADVALHALARLGAVDGAQPEMVLAGPENPGFRRELDALAAELGVTDRVRFRGPLQTEGLVELLARAHALVIPSVWQDPFPLVCIEGALARVPVVASDIGGIPECLAHGEHALLFPPGDAGACAAALAETLRDHEATAARVARAFQRGRHFSYEAYLTASAAFVDDAVAALAS